MLTYYVLYRNADKAEPAGVFIMDTAEGHALMWDHRRRSWSYNPGLAVRFLDDYRNLDRYEEVDRATIERVAVKVSGGTSLPDPESIEAMFLAEGGPSSGKA